MNLINENALDPYPFALATATATSALYAIATIAYLDTITATTYAALSASAVTLQTPLTTREANMNPLLKDRPVVKCFGDSTLLALLYLLLILLVFY